jgi:predicted RNA-binding protein with PUA domain
MEGKHYLIWCQTRDIFVASDECKDCHGEGTAGMGQCDEPGIVKECASSSCRQLSVMQ